MNPLTAQQKRAGFSLVEVLCAVLILGIALAGLTQGITAALSSTKESETQSAAVMLAASVMETIRAEGFVTEGSDEGEFDEEGLALYRWRQTISSGDIPGLYEVEVVIENSNTGQSIYELQTMLFDPPLESAAASSSKKETDGTKRRGRAP
ncbi:MAG: type IV pilus modification PilV family protein [Verrucomicrobiales bacterium]